MFKRLIDPPRIGFQPRAGIAEVRNLVGNGHLTGCGARASPSQGCAGAHPHGLHGKPYRRHRRTATVRTVRRMAVTWQPTLQATVRVRRRSGELRQEFPP